MADPTQELRSSGHSCDESKCLGTGRSERLGGSFTCYGDADDRLYPKTCAGGYEARVLDYAVKSNTGLVVDPVPLQYYTCCPPGQQDQGDTTTIRRHCSDPLTAPAAGSSKSQAALDAVCAERFVWMKARRMVPSPRLLGTDQKVAFVCCDSVPAMLASVDETNNNTNTTAEEDPATEAPTPSDTSLATSMDSLLDSLPDDAATDAVTDSVAGTNETTAAVDATNPATAAPTPSATDTTTTATTIEQDDANTTNATRFTDSTDCVPFKNDLLDPARVENRLGAIATMACDLEEFPIPTALEGSLRLDRGMGAPYRCCRSAAQTTPLLPYAQDAAFFRTVYPALAVYGLAALVLALALLGLLLSLFQGLRKSAPNDRSVYRSFDVYVVFMLLPTLAYCLLRIGLDGSLALERDFVTAFYSVLCVPPDGAPALLAPDLPIGRSQEVIFLWLAAVVSYQVLVLIRSSSSTPTRHMPPPGWTKMTLQALAIYILGGAYLGMQYVLLGIARDARGLADTERYQTLVWGLLVFDAFCHVLPISYSVFVGCCVGCFGYLPAGRTERERALRRLAGYSASLTLVFGLAWLPGFCLTTYGILVENASWAFVVWPAGALEALGCAVVVLVQSEAAPRLWECLTCKCCCPRNRGKKDATDDSLPPAAKPKSLRQSRGSYPEGVTYMAGPMLDGDRDMDVQDEEASDASSFTPSQAQHKGSVDETSTSPQEFKVEITTAGGKAWPLSNDPSDSDPEQESDPDASISDVSDTNGEGIDEEAPAYPSRRPTPGAARTTRVLGTGEIVTSTTMSAKGNALASPVRPGKYGERSSSEASARPPEFKVVAELYDYGLGDGAGSSSGGENGDA